MICLVLLITLPEELIVTTYRAIKADILRKITTGTWPPGSALPNEIDLAADYGCARATVNRAMRELADEGIIERKRKAGTHVRMAPERQARFAIPVVRSEIEAQGADYRYGLVASHKVKVPDWLRARLQLNADDRALHLTCMHYADGAPFQFEERWINLALLPQALDTDFSARSPTEWLIETIPFSDVEIGFSATAADAATADHLGCAVGDPLFRIERSTWWQGRAVTYVALTFHRGYRMTTRY